MDGAYNCWRLLAVWLGLLVSSTSALAADPVIPPRPSEYLANGQSDEYFSVALKFLDEHGSDQAAPMVAHDLVCLATMADRPKFCDDIKRRMLLDYPADLYTAYMLGPAAMNNGKDLRVAEFQRLMKSIFEDHERDFSTPLPGKYCQAVRAIARLLGPQTLNDATLMLETKLMATAASDDQLAADCDRQLSTLNSDDVKQIVESLGDNTDRAEMIARVHEKCDSALATSVECFLIGNLTAEKRDSSAVQRIVAENLLFEHNFQRALPVVEKILKTEDTPQVAYWQVVCHATLNHREHCQVAAAHMKTQHPQSPWTEKATELANRFESQETYLAANAKALHQVIQKLKASGADSLECKADLQWNEKAIGIYLAASLSDSLLELDLIDAGQMVVGYRTTDSESRMFVVGEQQIHAFAQKAMYPILAANFGRNPDTRKLDFNFNFNTSDNPASLQQSLAALTNSPALQSEEGLADLLDSLLETGWLAQKPQADEHGVVYRWARACITKPDVETWEVRISRDDELLSLKTASVDLKSIKIDRRDKLTLSPPDWPKVEVVKQDKFEAGTAFTMLANVVKWAEKYSDGKVAQKPKAAVR